ncbi:MAG: ABC transporter ATP-binding protein [Candidatus Latescibacteria bacterium]|nr:ABC transporter ATP-binding protein [Candidatus Latescibacterota bacterium]
MKINIKNLNKNYRGGIRALKDINLEVESGVFGLLGPNGAGKTTLMRILVTLMKPTEGQVTIDNMNLQKNRAKIRAMTGYLPQGFSMFSRLRTWEFLDYSARLAGLNQGSPRKNAVEEMLETLGLFEARDRQANKLSGGMKRRLGIGQALIGDPKILIVDEQTTGLDPEERLKFRNLLADMSRKDIIIILSTHIVGDILSSCTRMSLLNKGEVVFYGPPDSLVEQARGHTWLIKATDSELDKIKDTCTIISTVPSKEGWDVQVVSENLDGHQGTPIEPNLEHAYVYFLENKLGNSIDANELEM